MSNGVQSYFLSSGHAFICRSGRRKQRKGKSSAAALGVPGDEEIGAEDFEAGAFESESE
jgi:hypothetical protein